MICRYPVGAFRPPRAPLYELPIKNSVVKFGPRHPIQDGADGKLHESADFFGLDGWPSGLRQRS